MLSPVLLRLLCFFSRQKHKPDKFVLGQFLQLCHCAFCKFLYFCFYVGQGGGHCRYRISLCFLPVTADKVDFIKCELSPALIPQIPCFWSLPLAFSGQLLRFLSCENCARRDVFFSLSDSFSICVFKLPLSKYSLLYFSSPRTPRGGVGSLGCYSKHRIFLSPGQRPR